MNLKASVAIVTGAAEGIGRGIVLRLAREGARVVVADVNDQAGRLVVDEVTSAGATARFVHADVTVENEVAGLVAFAEQELGGLDVFVNNAGGVTPPYFPWAESEKWGKSIDLNLRGVMYGVQHAVRSMAHRNGGSIINIASMGGVGFESYDKPEYGAAKAGVMRLTASLAHLANDINVRVNCICPGLVDTPASRKGRAALSDAGRAAFDASPKLVPDDIADAVMMFLEDDALAGRVLLWNEGEPWHLVPRSAPY